MNNPTLLAMICFLGMISPGPDFLLVTRNALSLPKPQALATAFGIVAGCLVHATYCTLGLAIVITQSILLFPTIKYLGACYLVYLGIKCLFSKPSAADFEPTEKYAVVVSVRQAFMQGFLCNVLNPKLAVFLLSLFTQFISVNATTADKVAVAAIFFTEAAIYWPLLVLLLQGGRVQSAFARFRGGPDRVCGAMLVYLGVRIAVSRE